MKMMKMTTNNFRKWVSIAKVLRASAFTTGILALVSLCSMILVLIIGANYIVIGGSAFLVKFPNDATFAEVQGKHNIFFQCAFGIVVLIGSFVIMTMIGMMTCGESDEVFGRKRKHSTGRLLGYDINNRMPSDAISSKRGVTATTLGMVLATVVIAIVFVATMFFIQDSDVILAAVRLLSWSSAHLIFITLGVNIATAVYLSLAKWQFTKLLAELPSGE